MLKGIPKKMEFVEAVKDFKERIGVVFYIDGVVGCLLLQMKVSIYILSLFRI